MLDTKTLYQTLYAHMGPQGWWPAQSSIEIIIGAILVQNTNWNNAARAIEQLKDATDLQPKTLLRLTDEQLQTLIRPSGFYKNKARTLQTVLSWFEIFNFDYQAIKSHYQQELRAVLLRHKGIGEETADVLLVYVFGEVQFIPDSYTRRIYYKLGYPNTTNYRKFKQHIVLPSDFEVQDANEFHALLDNFGKVYFNSKQPHRYTFLDEYFIR